jgi:hypothetical protein
MSIYEYQAVREVRSLADGADFEIGKPRHDGRGTYRIFVVYSSCPWQGVLELSSKKWTYFGESWPL